MEKKMETTVVYWGYITPIMENQMEKKMENEMEAGVICFLSHSPWKDCYDSYYPQQDLKPYA